MFYVPEGEATFFPIIGGEQEMVHCEGGAIVIIPVPMRALFASCVIRAPFGLDSEFREDCRQLGS
jgi:hypothetical protein